MKMKSDIEQIKTSFDHLTTKLQRMQHLFGEINALAIEISNDLSNLEEEKINEQGLPSLAKKES